MIVSFPPDATMRVHISELLKLTDEQRAAVLAQLTDAQCDELEHCWEFNARPQQLPPLGNWTTWLFLAGRGSGKTRAGAEWVRSLVKKGYKRIGMIAPTMASVRDVMLSGSGGLLDVCWEHDRADDGTLLGRPTYEASKSHLVRWANGAWARAYSAEEPERLRGPNFDAVWADELAAWFRPNEAWDMAMFALRLGDAPRVMVTTTPKPIPLLLAMISDEKCAITRSSTYANRANLSPDFFKSIIKKYEDTRLGRQELDGEILEEVDGALWTRQMIEDCRQPLGDKPLSRIVVAIDPAVSSGATSNLTGIVVAGVRGGHGYVLADKSGRYSPSGWAQAAIAAFDEWGADRIVAEGNQGGEMVRHTLESVRKNIPVTIVHASRGKQARAEPVAALYEQRRVHHVEPFPELETQMATWEPLEGEASPDRLDAMVWAITNLMVECAPDVPFIVPYVYSRPSTVRGLG